MHTEILGAKNSPPKPSAFKPDPFTPAEDEDSKPKTKYRIGNKTKELKDLEDDPYDSCVLEEYRYFQLPQSYSHFMREKEVSRDEANTECLSFVSSGSIYGGPGSIYFNIDCVKVIY
uniref:Uncharacterized protein n=1 Tax=Lactuca sativa TaxID=4236 RepID=A0A9R1WZ08_LACSA|nr:hypothetical protein LSAT_V11C800443710 [Lactuca sativa]